MFCESCGTVLDEYGQCVNCDKKLERESDTVRQANLSPDVVR